MLKLLENTDKKFNKTSYKDYSIIKMLKSVIQISYEFLR